LVDERVLRGQGKAALVVALRDFQLVLHFNVEGAASISEQLLHTRRADRRLDQLKRIARIADRGYHGRIEQERQHVAFLGHPTNLRRGQRELLLDPDLLRNGFRDRRFSGSRARKLRFSSQSGRASKAQPQQASHEQPGDSRRGPVLRR
jgi:hypothetical protein